MGERRGLAGVVSSAFIASWVVVRVAFFTGIALAVFLLAFLGYFTLPFIFIVIALALLGMSGGIRQLTRLRAWVRSGLRR
jgi:hypothetical protein